MNIIFGLNFSSNVFLDMAKRGGILYDETIVNTAGLVDLLSLHLGVHRSEGSLYDRQTAYYDAFSRVMEKENNVFSASWKSNALGVSNACLIWRDALIESGWKASMPQPSDRLSVIAKVEADFKVPGMADELVLLAELLQKQCSLPQGSTIYIAATSLEMLPPIVAKIFRLMETQGVKLVFETETAVAETSTNLHKIQQLILGQSVERLDEKDSSFEIWNFPTSLDACRYITSNKDNLSTADVYISSDAKMLDNVQRMLHQPTSGSLLCHAFPQIEQLFKLGLSLFDYPFNIRNMVSWLMMPIHPIPYELRHKLGKALISEGGQHNSTYEDAISAYKDKISEEKGKSQNEKIDDLLTIFIPTPHKEGVDKSALITFLSSLSSWCMKMVKSENYTDIKSKQFLTVRELCDGMQNLVRKEISEWIPYANVESWASSLNHASNIDIFPAQAGSLWTVNAADMADVATSTLWTDCYNYMADRQDSEFLNATEMNALTEKGCEFWDKDKYNVSVMREAMRPVLSTTRKLILVTVQKHKNAETTKHPLLIRLEAYFGDNLKAFVKHLTANETETVEVVPVNNVEISTDESMTAISFKEKKAISFRERESSTSLDSLTQYPLDYFLDKILLLNDYSSNDLVDLNTTKGNVAHAVIEKLFVGSNDTIREHISMKFEATLDEAVLEKGALLLLKENVIEFQLFKEALKENIEALLEIIQDSNLEVVANEKNFEVKMGLLDGQQDPRIIGFIDMLLKTRDGDFVIFDFKWTSSKSKHQNLLENNASIQLALYEEAVKRLDKGNRVVATAYFTMPKKTLYTTSKMLENINNVKYVEPENRDSLISKIIQSYRYRREEIAGGTIALEEGHEINDELPYVSNTERQNLVPLSVYKNIHTENLYSNFKCFKTKLK